MADFSLMYIKFPHFGKRLLLGSEILKLAFNKIKSNKNELISFSENFDNPANLFINLFHNKQNNSKRRILGTLLLGSNCNSCGNSCCLSEFCNTSTNPDTCGCNTAIINDSTTRCEAKNGCPQRTCKSGFKCVHSSDTDENVMTC